MKVSPSPRYATWSDYLARTMQSERLKWCASKAITANRNRRTSQGPEIRITADHVWNVLARARGRCAHCGSFAVEEKPYDRNLRRHLPWEHMGRRIGSLEHVKSRLVGGGNETNNLVWSCLCCNSIVEMRRLRATDYGGFYPEDSDGGPSLEIIFPRVALSRSQLKAIRVLFKEDGPVERDETGEPVGGPWSRGEDEALEIDDRIIVTELAAVKWVVSHPVEQRDAAIRRLQEVADEVDGDHCWEFLPDHEHPEDTAMWRDTFG